MNPVQKRFNKEWLPIANAVARLDVDQEDRELVADALTETLRGRRDFRAELFRLLASDPLVPCAGARGEPCPHGREIRIAMHDRGSESGRSVAWRRRPEEIRCVTCGAVEFIPGYAERSGR